MSSVSRNDIDDSSGGSTEEMSYDGTSRDPKEEGSDVGLEPDLVHQTFGFGSLERHGRPGVPNREAHQHTTLFFLSLIEARCRTLAANSINKDRDVLDQLPENHHEVLEVARHLFAETSKELHQAGILPDEFAARNLEDLRLQYLNSFDTILNNIALRRAYETDTHGSINESEVLSINTDPSSSAFPGALARRLYTMATTPPLPTSISSFMLRGNSNSLNQHTHSAYESDFQEIELLGKGGFGAVYRVKNHLDDHEYAIKKIIMSSDSLSSLKEPDGVKKLLSELRTLARLQHHSVVRYHTGWVEFVPAGAHRAALEAGDMSSTFLTRTLETLHSGATVESQLKNLNMGTGDNGGQFDDEDPFDRSGISGEPEEGTSQAREPSHSDGRSKALAKHKSVFFRSASSMSSTEEIALPIETPKQKDVILYIQMGLHPMTLEDYIWGEKPVGGARVQHCFHTPICIRILLLILDGIEYIHNENIVHRDLKPSNIFLSVQHGRASEYEGTIDITECGQCAGGKEITTTERTFIIPHIGDFGLAAEVKPGATGDKVRGSSAEPMVLAMVSSQQTNTQHQPGTKFYCPPIDDNTICTKLDVYSLGVIAFELVTKFGTKSERAIVLAMLSKGVFPDGFDKHDLATGIKGMLCGKREERWTCAQVRKWLRNIQVTYNK